MDVAPEVDVVVLAYGEERWLRDCLDAVLASRDVRVRVLLVDNGSPRAAGEAARDPRVTLVTPGRNTGYAGGCTLAASQGTAPVVAFVNSDAVVEPAALRLLADALADHDVGLVTGCVLLAGGAAGRPGEPGTLVNAAGNPVHWLGYSWAGGLGDPVERHRSRRDVASISGALFATRRAHWELLGGFDPAYFAYQEDVDLSWRTWCVGRRVVYLPEARCVHHYEFSRHPGKLELLERNRLLTVLTVYQPGTLARVLPVLVATELGSLLVAVRNGWGPAKLRAWGWLAGHPGHLRERRGRLARIRQVPDRAWLGVLDNRLELPAEAPGRIPGPVRAVLRAYWRLLRP